MPASEDVVVGLYAYDAPDATNERGERAISFAQGDRIVVLERRNDGWIRGRHELTGSEGLVPGVCARANVFVLVSLTLSLCVRIGNSALHANSMKLKLRCTYNSINQLFFCHTSRTNKTSATNQYSLAHTDDCLSTL
jgi:hypothetical protein